MLKLSAESYAVAGIPGTRSHPEESPMASPRPTLLRADELERRDAPAVLSYTAPSGNGPDLVTVRLDAAGKKVLILDNGVQVASKTLNTTDSVAVTASAGEGDSLAVDTSTGFVLPTTFNGGASGAAAKITTSGGQITLDFSTSAKAITADIGTTATNGNFAGGGAVSVVGAVSSVIGTGGDDTFVDHTTISLLSLDGRLGDDTYYLDPGSTI